MKRNIVLLSDCSFPFGYAGSQKNRILMKALSDEGADVQVLILPPPQKKNKKKGKYEKITFTQN